MPRIVATVNLVAAGLGITIVPASLSRLPLEGVTYRTLGGKNGGRDGLPVNYDQRKVTTPELYDVDADIGEAKNVAAEQPAVVERLLALAEQARRDLGDSLTGRVGAGVREPGRLTEE